MSEWLNGDPGSLEDNRGRVVLIEFFQLWCPGCTRFSRPLFRRWDRLYGERDDIRLVSIHSVFEGHGHQTVTRLRDYLADHQLTHSVGIDAYGPDDDETPLTMKRYRTRGTPQVVIVDKQGRLRWTRFGGFDPAAAERVIDQLLAEPGPEAGPK
ncbi:hypothetical protein ABI59_21570 [Acidobacteria bacterium Mor1]|nr:hypothetical protein ABI59_21570 [Acidobacteria bacterium Mor1]